MEETFIVNGVVITGTLVKLENLPQELLEQRAQTMRENPEQGDVFKTQLFLENAKIYTPTTVLEAALFLIDENSIVAESMNSYVKAK
jgi:hypothetical protein